MQTLPRDILGEIHRRSDDVTWMLFSETCRVVGKNVYRPNTQAVAEYVVRSVHLAKWAISRGVDLSMVTRHASVSLDVLMWTSKNDIPQSHHTGRNAAYGGHLTALLYTGMDQDQPYAYIYATLTGCFSILQHGIRRSATILEHAAQSDSRTVLLWMNRVRCEEQWGLCDRAENNRNPFNLQWVWNNGYQFTEFTCENVARYGGLTVLLWARAHGAICDGRTCMRAAKLGCLPMLTWAVSRGLRCGVSTGYCAAKGGQITILRWLKIQQCPWDSWTCAQATCDVHTLTWARSNDCPWSVAALSEAAWEGTSTVLLWGINQNCPASFNILHIIVDSGHFAITMWAEKRRPPWYTTIYQGLTLGVIKLWFESSGVVGE